MERILNLIQSPIRGTDWHLRGILKAPSSLPSSVNLQEFCGEILDQKNTGFCVYFCSAALKNWQEKKETGINYSMSPLYMAKQVKNIDGMTNTEGSYIQYAMKILKEKGIIEEKYYPFTQYREGSLIFPEIKNEDSLSKFKISNYAKCDSIEDIKLALSMGRPVALGIACGKSIYTLDNNASNYIPIPIGEFLIGGHALCIIGYDDNLVHNYGTTYSPNIHKGYFKVQNSWGLSWGDSGYGWIPYDYLTFETKDYHSKIFWSESWSSIDMDNDPIQGKKIELFTDKNTIITDGAIYQLDATPYIEAKAGRCMVPVRFISNFLGFHVEWIESEKRVDIKDSATTVSLWVGEKDAIVNGQKKRLDQPPVIKNNRTFVPVRFIGESFHCTVLWDNEKEKVTILKK